MSQNLDKTLAARWARLADQPAPRRPAGPVGQLANHVLTYTSPTHVPVVLPHLDQRTGGLVLAGAHAIQRRHRLDTGGHPGPVVIDPAAYEHYTATPRAPFWLPDGQLSTPTLTETLDQQRQAGAPVALTPTGYITADDVASLQAATRVVRALGRRDVVFVVPVDVSLVDNPLIDQVTAILADADCPIGLILGGDQSDPLHTAPERIIPNLRNLAASVAVMPLRTDLNAVDLVAHGAFAGAIGTSSRLRRTVDPAVRVWWNHTDTSPSVLFVELLSWWRGRKIADLYGQQDHKARVCLCVVCQRRRPTRFVDRRYHKEAMAHTVAVWSSYVATMLAKPTMRGRAEYWRTLCAGSVREHEFISKHLKLYGKAQLQPQAALQQWATLPAWPVDTSASTP